MVEAFKAIKQAEEQAERIVSEAHEKVKEMKRTTQIEALAEQKKIIADAVEAAREAVQVAEEEGKREALPIKERGKSERATILNVSEDKLQEAVALLMERIVN